MITEWKCPFCQMWNKWWSRYCKHCYSWKYLRPFETRDV